MISINERLKFIVDNEETSNDIPWWVSLTVPWSEKELRGPWSALVIPEKMLPEHW